MISVIICTYNRCESLKDTLESLLTQECDDNFDYEIIAVDNNSKDKTKDVIESYIPKFNGRLRYIFEPRQGLSHARNRGVCDAIGEVIAFTDDDVVVDKSWIESIYTGFHKFNCDALCGRILPMWNKRPPHWLTKRFYANLALLDYGDRSFRIDSDRYEFYGANFSVKKSIFTEMGYFNTSLGRKGKNLLSGEETDLFKKLLSSNKIIQYQPDCFVRHKINNERMSKTYFRRWYFYSGLLQFNANRLMYREDKKKYPFGVPYWLFKRLFRSFGRYLNVAITKNKSFDKLFEDQLDIFQHLGIIYGAYKTRILR